MVKRRRVEPSPSRLSSSIALNPRIRNSLKCTQERPTAGPNLPGLGAAGDDEGESSTSFREARKFHFDQRRDHPPGPF